METEHISMHEIYKNKKKTNIEEKDKKKRDKMCPACIGIVLCLIQIY